MKKNIDEYVFEALNEYEENLLANPETIQNSELICKLDDGEAAFLELLDDEQIAAYTKYARILFEYKYAIKEEYFSAGFIKGLNTKKSQIKI
ncbi:MAG: hypothetical protein IJZ35_04785 [Clostridia bacterium]|nr:hypothetical protein [Clostridia bacterium]